MRASASLSTHYGIETLSLVTGAVELRRPLLPLRREVVGEHIGRLDDISETGMELIEKIVTIYHNYDFGTEVLVASVRNPTHVVDAALIGADICTIPFPVMLQLAKHPLTDVGLQKFVEDAKKIPK